MRINFFACIKYFSFFLLVFLAGCMSPSHPVLGSDYLKYSETYADANNQQLLLNLARLANDDPVNFIQLGSFSSQYGFSAGLGFTPSSVNNAPLDYTSASSQSTGSTPPSGQDVVSSSTTAFIKDALTFGGSVSVGVTATPIFQFFPLTGSNLVNAILAPINDKVFYTYYGQGYPADLLLRTMVTSVAYQTGITTNIQTNWIPTGKIEQGFTTNYFTLVRTNDGWPVTTLKKLLVPVWITNWDGSYSKNTITNLTTNYVYYVNNPMDHRYPDFLNFCSKMYEAQFTHVLTIGKKPGGDAPVYNNANPRLTDVVAAVQASLDVKYDTNSDRVKVSKPQQDYAFLGNTNDLASELWASSDAITIASPAEIENKQANFFVADSLSPTNNGDNIIKLAIEFDQNKYTLQMRTPEAAMYTVANEDGLFGYQNKLNTNRYALFTQSRYANAQVMIPAYTNLQDIIPKLNKDIFRLRWILEANSQNVSECRIRASIQDITQDLKLSAINVMPDATYAEDLNRTLRKLKSLKKWSKDNSIRLNVANTDTKSIDNDFTNKVEKTLAAAGNTISMLNALYAKLDLCSIFF